MNSTGKAFLQLLTILLVNIASYAHAQVHIEEGVKYTLNGDHYEVTAFDLASVPPTESEDVTVAIADDIDGVPVTVIADNAFDATVNSDCAKITSVDLGNNITTIGNYAFYLCKGLKEIYFYYKLETIGKNAFYGCTALTSIELPATMKKVDNSAFYGCRSISSLSVESDNLEIGTSAFAACSSLYTIRFFGTVPLVGSTAFYNVGSASTPTNVYVPINRFHDYITLMIGEGEQYRWKNGEGYMCLRTEDKGFVYSYIAPKAPKEAFLRIAAIHEKSLVNKGTEENPAYLLQSAKDINGIKVIDIANGAFKTSQAANIYAVDLRLSDLKDFTVDRTTGTFAGISTQTLIYLPIGNHSIDANVIIGDQVATQLQIGRPIRPITEEEVVNGRAVWLFNNQRKQQLFGQEIGVDATPLPITDINKQTVWQATFIHKTTRQYRCANTNGTVIPPSATDMGFAEGAIANYYEEDEIEKPFTNATPLISDVNIYAYPKVTGLTLNISELTFKMSTPEEQRKSQLNITTTPIDGRQEVIWTSNNPKIARVDENGIISVLSAGSAIVTATSKDNSAVSAQCQITVIPKAERIEIADKEVTIALTAISEPIYQLTANIYPKDAIQDVIWESQKPEVATIDENGLVTGLAQGHAAITATSKDNPSLMAICYVTVLPAADSVWISRYHYVMLAGDLEQLRAKVLPSTAIQAIKWTTSDASVASVSDEGVVTARSQGEATITATSKAMPSLSNQCIITVAGVGTKTTIDDYTYEITKLEHERLTMKIIKVSDQLLSKGGAIILPTSAWYARLDFDVNQVADDAIGQLTNNTIFYIPATMSYKGKADNVVILDNKENTCNRLVITDGYDFVTPYSFKASEVIYRRTCSLDKPFAFSAPYSVSSNKSTCTYYELKEQHNTTLVFKEVDTTIPYKPYIALSKVEQLDLRNTDITLTPYESNTDVYVGDCQFIATMKHLDCSSLIQYNGHKVNELRWEPFEENEIINPMSAWLSSPIATLDIKLQAAEATGIHDISVERKNVIYNLRGESMRSDMSHLPKGIYIINGKKIVKK